MSDATTAGPAAGDATASPPSPTIEEWIDEHARSILKWRYIALSTMGLAACSFAAAKSRGVWFWLSIVGALLMAGLGATIAWARDHLVRSEKQRADLAAMAAEQVATRIWGTFAGAGFPLVTTLGRICAARPDERYDPLAAMIPQVLDVARVRIGTESTQNRAVLYERRDRDTLVLDATWAGRQRPGRDRWHRTAAPDLGRAVLDFLDGAGGQCLNYPDVRKRRPDGFGDPDEVSYRSFLAVRVVAGDERLGLLCVDSPIPGNFTDQDRSAMILLGGLLGAGMAAAQRGCQA